jgi:hypothetical protein
MVHHFTCAEIFQFRSDKCRTLARLYMKKFNDLPQTIVVVDHQAILYIGCICHVAEI